ncbi:MAG: GTP 3',8-cyclase MoaA [Acidobacteriota bacterium]|nr:MAG: GTP 3',8-cyclase [Thermoanaerobaculum sp.]
MTAQPPPSLKPQTLRLSLTDRCNLRCRYCMPAKGVAFIPHSQLPSLEELAQAVAFLVQHLRVNRVKLTGGEPLVRKGVVELVAMLAGISGIEEVSMTTNGTRLAVLAAELKAAGLSRVNVSLDTLNPERFRELTRGGDVREVLAGIAAAQREGLLPVKLNAVLRASSFREDVPELLAYACAQKLELRFIELMRTGTEAAWAEREYVSAQKVQAFLAQQGELIPLVGQTNGPARRTLFRFSGGEVLLGWITPVSHSFCDACNRLRLDAQGRLRRCLMDPYTVPLVALLRQGEEKALAELWPYLADKRPPAAMQSQLPMSAVGG